MEKIPFLEVFAEHPNGALSPKRVINVNGITFGQGVVFNTGLTFGGIDFHLFKYLDIAAENKEGVLIIQGFYR